MWLRELELDEFRSFRSLRLEIDPAGFRAIGPNASGKSTLLEAIAMLATFRSPRTSLEREVVNWNSGVEFAVPPYARAHAVFERTDGQRSVEFGLSFDERLNRIRKSVRYDGRQTRAVDAVGQLKTVLFTPEDVELLSGAPSGRRRFLDIAIGQASRDYLRGLAHYARVLEQRNSLLRSLAAERAGSNSRAAQELPFWDSELTAVAADVLAFRLGAVQFLGTAAAAHFSVLHGGGLLAIHYRSHRDVIAPLPAGSGRWEPDVQERQRAASAFGGILASVRAEELRRGVTAVGPHRDDFIVEVDGVDLGRFGSRGQQRLAVIAMKLAELDFLASAAGEPPVLLLDDVLSELDASHRSLMTAALGARATQVCVTSTDESDLHESGLDRLPLLRMANGTINAAKFEES
ncbi:MAG: DNA replication and repair protein RecF [Thermomicrobiales bacterium]